MATEWCGGQVADNPYKNMRSHGGPRARFRPSGARFGRARPAPDGKISNLELPLNHDLAALISEARRGHTKRPRARSGPGPQGPGAPARAQDPGPKAPGHTNTQLKSTPGWLNRFFLGHLFLVWFVVGPGDFQEGPGSPQNPDAWPGGLPGAPRPPGARATQTSKPILFAGLV
jgi:hypothetical protein